MYQVLPRCVFIEHFQVTTVFELLKRLCELLTFDDETRLKRRRVRIEVTLILFYKSFRL